jgi:hypothetical protein
MSRETISAVQLYAILDREFQMGRPMACKACRIPLPYYRTPPDEVSANWAVGTPRDCPTGCHKLIAEMVTKLWSKYDIEPERAQ